MIKEISFSKKLTLACTLVMLYLIAISKGLAIGFCPFKWMTGLACPACGASRATLMFLEGRIIDAIALNPLSLCIVAALFVSPILLFLDSTIKTDLVAKCKFYFDLILSNRYGKACLALLIGLLWCKGIYQGI